MNSRDIQNLSEAYLSIYDDLNEANRWEKYRGLTPKERKDERNKNVPFRGDYSKKDPATAERRFTHQQQRGISPKKRLDDIRRNYNFNDSEYEKKSEEERVFHNEVPRMPAPRHGRRKPLGANTIKRMQPHLYSSRTRAKRRKELDTQNSISRENERKEMDKKSQNNWKTMMSIDDLQNRIRTKRAKNKIVPFHREELEYLISYLLDEGYAYDLSSAENIAIHMSEEWAYEILNEGSLYDMFKAHSDELGASIQRDKERAARIKALSDKAAQFASPDTGKQAPSSEPKRTRQQIISDIKKKLDDAEEVIRRQEKTK